VWKIPKFSNIEGKLMHLKVHPGIFFIKCQRLAWHFKKAMGVGSQAEDFTLFSILVLPTN
jgi:hypothetical protein